MSGIFDPAIFDPAIFDVTSTSGAALSAGIQAASNVTGTVSTGIYLSGLVSVQSGTVSSLTAEIRFASNISAQSAIQAAFAGSAAALSANIPAISACSAYLQTEIRLGSVLPSNSGVSAALQSNITLSGAVSAASGMYGALLDRGAGRRAVSRPVWDDPTDFLDLDEFGSVIHVLGNNGSIIRTFSAIFDEPATSYNYRKGQSINPPSLGDYDIDPLGPSIFCPSESAIGLHRGDVVEVQNRIYDVIRAPLPDGTGWTRVPLSPAGDDL